MEDYPYRLNAYNKQGAGIKFYGKSVADCLRQFDSEYHRKGFKIEVYKYWDLVREVKKTFN